MLLNEVEFEWLVLYLSVNMHWLRTTLTLDIEICTPAWPVV